MNLKVAVISAENVENEITPASSVEEILACEDTVIYSLGNYFEAQNEESLGLHWSFLIDMDSKQNLTGINN